MEKHLFRLALVVFSVPGLVVRTASTQLVCRLIRSPILKLPTHPVDHVVFDSPQSTLVHWSMLISIGLVNLVIGSILVLPIAIRWIYFGSNDPALFALGVLGLSIASESFPGGIDAAVLWTKGLTESMAATRPFQSQPSPALLYFIAATRGTFAYIWLPLAAIRGMTIFVVEFVTRHLPSTQ